MPAHARTEPPSPAQPSHAAGAAPLPVPLRSARLGGAAAGSIAAGLPGDAAALRTKALYAVTLRGFEAARPGPARPNLDLCPLRRAAAGVRIELSGAFPARRCSA